MAYWKMLGRRNKKNMVHASMLAVSVLSSATVCAAKTIEKHTNGKAYGRTMHDDQKEVWNEDVTVNVSGNGGGQWYNNVTGLYLLEGADLTINGNLKMVVKNKNPATRGKSSSTSDIAHYYMSGIYAGYGGFSYGEQHGDTKCTINGNVDMDVVGVALQANKDGYITVRGGKIVTHALTTSDTYAMLAEEGSVFMNTGADGKTPGTADVDVYGNLGVLHKNYGIDPNPDAHGSFVSIGLTTAKSKLTGGVLNEFAENGQNPHQSGVDMYLKNGAVWNNQWIGAERVAAPNRADKNTYLYTGSKVRNLVGGASDAERGHIHQKDTRPITVENYSGHEAVHYGRAADGSLVGGNFVVKHAATGSQVTLSAQNPTVGKSLNEEEYKAEVEKSLQALASKLSYTGYVNGERNLRGIAAVEGGLIAPAAKMQLDYQAADGQAKLSSPIFEKETPLVRGAKSAMLASSIFWMGNNNDLRRRMGDLRLGSAENGIWVKYLGGKTGVEDEHLNLRQNYHITQLGYDRKVKDWTTGIALEYGTSSASYGNGSGKGRLSGIALYGSMQKDDGQYLDIIGKGTHLNNEYSAYTDSGYRMDGDYGTHGFSLSVEYGKKLPEKNGFYVEPSVELTYGHLDGADYDAPTNVAGKKIRVQQDAFNSTVGRIGIGIGTDTPRSNIFMKIALAHEFSGTMTSKFTAPSEPTSSTEIDLKDTWVDVELGGSHKLNDSSYIYGTYTKNFGATLDNKWRADVGVRFLF